MNATPRYSTLRDYLRVLRTQRWVILGVTVLFAAASFLVSSRQEKEYTAQESLWFRDVSQDLNLVGQQSIPELAPDQRAAINADRVNTPEVAESVKKSLGTDLTTGQIRSQVSTEVGARTNFVIIRATDRNPEFAAKLANAYGSQVQAADQAEVRRRIDKVIKGLRANIKRDRKVSDAQGAFLTQQVNQTQIAQLQTVRELARPVEIARAAEVPQDPSSPKTTRNTILGAIAGLVFGLLAGFLRDSLDRRLRNTDEVQAEVQLPVLGKIPDGALGEAGFANGVVGDAEAHLEAFRMLRTNLELLPSGGPMKSVMVTSGLPEEGKSTVAMALAGAAAIAGKRTLLVECDLRRPSFAERLEIDDEPGLADYLVGEADPADILQVVELSAPSGPNGNGLDESDSVSRMVCITAGSRTSLPAEMLGSERFSSFLTEVSKAYDIVVLDTAPLLSVVDALEIAPQVDGLLVCVRLAQTTRDEVRAARDALGQLPGRPTGVVITGYRPSDDSYYGYYGNREAER